MALLSSELYFILGRYFDARMLNSIFISFGIHCVDFLPNKYNQIVVSMKYNIVLNLELFKAKEIQMHGSGGNVTNVHILLLNCNSL